MNSTLSSAISTSIRGSPSRHSPYEHPPYFHSSSNACSEKVTATPTASESTGSTSPLLVLPIDLQYTVFDELVGPLRRNNKLSILLDGSSISDPFRNLYNTCTQIRNNVQAYVGEYMKQIIISPRYGLYNPHQTTFIFDLSGYDPESRETSMKTWLDFATQNRNNSNIRHLRFAVSAPKRYSPYTPSTKKLKLMWETITCIVDGLRHLPNIRSITYDVKGAYQFCNVVRQHLSFRWWEKEGGVWDKTECRVDFTCDKTCCVEMRLSDQIGGKVMVEDWDGDVPVEQVEEGGERGE